MSSNASAMRVGSKAVSGSWGWHARTWPTWTGSVRSCCGTSFNAPRTRRRWKRCWPTIRRTSSTSKRCWSWRITCTSRTRPSAPASACRCPCSRSCPSRPTARRSTGSNARCPALAGGSAGDEPHPCCRHRPPGRSGAGGRRAARQPHDGTRLGRYAGDLSLSRFNHRLPRGQAHSEVMQGTAQFHHEIADAFFPQADPVFDDATTLDTAVDMLDPQPPLVECLVRPLLLRRELLSQIEINSCVEHSTSTPLRQLHPLHRIVFLSHGV